MGSILKHLEGLSRRKRLVAFAKREMNSGETWIYPVQLRKGKLYLIHAARSARAARIDCSLTNDFKETLSQSHGSTRTHLSIVPREDGDYNLSVSLGRGIDERRPEKVTLTVKHNSFLEDLSLYSESNKS